MKNGKKILVSGSIVIDTIFDIKGNINNSITFKDGKLGAQNFMFTGKEKNEFFGGTGGNIAYGLSLLGEKSILTSVVGKDFEDRYGRHLKGRADLRLFVDKAGYTANFYAMSDEKNQQIGIFQPNSYFKYLNSISLSKLIPKNDLKNIAYAIFSPGTGPSILKQIKELKKINPDVFIILDPGQAILVSFSKEILLSCLKLSNLLIVNEHELSQIKNNLGVTLEKIFKTGTKFVIETKSELGSVLHEPHKRTQIKPEKVKKVLDPTGAGDAYRAGLIAYLSQGRSLPEAMQLGSKMGAKCVKKVGGQTYSV